MFDLLLKFFRKDKLIMTLFNDKLIIYAPNVTNQILLHNKVSSYDMKCSSKFLQILRSFICSKFMTVELIILIFHSLIMQLLNLL